MPILRLFRRHTVLVLVAALVFAGNNAVGYMTTGGYIQNYSTDPEGPLALDRGPVLWAVTGSAVTWLLSTILAGWVSDRLGRRATYLLGWVLQARRRGGPVPAGEHRQHRPAVRRARAPHRGPRLHLRPAGGVLHRFFPASIRFSGVSISYAIGAIAGGAFAPTIATALVSATGSTTSVTWYLAGMTVIGLLATLVLRDRSGIPLGPDHEAEQQVSPVRGLAKV